MSKQMISQVGYLLGSTVRHSLELLAYPYRALSSALFPDVPPPSSPLRRRLPPSYLTEELRRSKRRRRAGQQDAPLDGTLVEQLHDPDPTVRAAAAAAAGRSGRIAAVFALILSLEDEEPAVREEAQHAIERIVGHGIDFDPHAGASRRRQAIEDLKAWWKEVRFAQLTESLD